ncbi:protein L-Myc-1a-like [Clarias magur]|uniref:Protein L-Myc-1a-like n=1 Tax=Clarias magur TaxID=1594786 RepID=A0A8J4WTT7_CLAMG|nr:protein L-Myc-1a-like [Clarias magur]
MEEEEEKLIPVILGGSFNSIILTFIIKVVTTPVCGLNMCDHLQHYFYDELDGRIEDFFTSTAPSEDIWKKFELLPTPPGSPSRTSPAGRMVLPLPATERSSWGSDDYGVKKLDPLDLFGNMSSVVIKDCMWSGGFTATRVSPLPETHQNELVHVNAPRIQSAARQPDAQTARCVNPAAVLNLPVAQTRKTPASSGSESRSDSSGKSSGTCAIDVVTVENRLKKRTRTPITIAVSAGPRNKHFHISLHRQQHNYAAPSPESEDERRLRNPDDDCDEEPPRDKRARVALSAPSSSSSSPASSDSEDATEQRRNFLERKRRDDLRSRFQMLRNEVPGLSESAKTSKVAILTHATEYLLQLQAREKRQAQERKKLRARRQLLLRKISALKKP